FVSSANGQPPANKRSTSSLQWHAMWPHTVRALGRNCRRQLLRFACIAATRSTNTPSEAMTVGMRLIDSPRPGTHETEGGPSATEVGDRHGVRGFRVAELRSGNHRP